MTAPSSHAGIPAASIVIPAHNEERVIGRLLEALTVDADPRTFEIVVVCNGCTDATADVARSAGDHVEVVELTEPSKHAALRAGDATASAFPRVFVDADVEISARSVHLLVRALQPADILAAGPTRRIPRDRSSRSVRAYYDVWEQLPSVRSGLFGRGVIALSEAGHERIRGLPAMMGDDLVMSEAFEEDERTIVDDAIATIRPPRTIGDLHRRRVRAATGNAQADSAGLRRQGARTTTADLIAVVRADPALIVRLPVFVAISIAGKLAARRAVRKGDYVTWRRDETSRL